MMFGEVRALGQDREGDGAAASTRGLRVMIVEDELIIAWELSEMLAQLGHDVCGVAVDTAEAVALAERTQPDLILMDVWLRHGDDGIVAAETIKARQPVLIVFASAYGGDPATRARMMAAKAAGILSKPILLKDLRRAMAEALRIPPD